jgi:hypothetical protein
MIQKTFETYTSKTLEYLAKHPQCHINFTFELPPHDKVSEKLLSENQELNSFSDDSLSTKDSEENSECPSKKNIISQKKSYKKAPQGKMDTFDEELLLSLASKYKHDWKKVSKKIFKLHKKKLGPNLLRIRYKELAPDLTQKRVRFTHKEDLLIVKLYSQHGYDWEKIASEFESRTSIMVKNRFYHIKKKNILQSLLNEVEATTTFTLEEKEPQQEVVVEEQQPMMQESQNETFHYFTQKGDEISSQKLNIFSEENLFHKYDDQLCDKISPLGDWSYSNNNFMEEDNYYSLTSFMGQRFLYF